MSNVKSYTDKQLLDRIKELGSFRYIPSTYWVLGVQSNEDAFNEFDDKFYVFHKETFIMVLTGTTNAGSNALLNYKKYNPLGTAIIKTNEWYYKLWTPGLHKKRMECLKQIRPILHYRDSNKNKSSEESGKLYNKLIGCEFHTATYSQNMNFIRRWIGGWSAACQVANNTGDYHEALSLFWSQKDITYCLIKEF